MIAQLTNRAVAKIAGKDAISFLQGLITNDAALLAQGQPIFTALLSPQGKFLFDFFIVPHGEEFLIDADKARLPELLKRLGFYRLRAAVTCEELPDYRVAASWEDSGFGMQGAGDKGQEARSADRASLVGEAVRLNAEVSRPQQEQSYINFPDPRLSALGTRIIGTSLPAATASMEDYERHRIVLGVPDGAQDLIADRSLLLAYGYDMLHAVSFTKGCYVGQEVTARSKHRGTLRRMLYQVHAETSLPIRATSVLAGEEVIGELLSVAGKIGLALLEGAGVESGKPLTAAGISLQANHPAWWGVNSA